MMPYMMPFGFYSMPGMPGADPAAAAGQPGAPLSLEAMMRQQQQLNMFMAQMAAMNPQYASQAMSNTNGQNPMNFAAAAAFMFPGMFHPQNQTPIQQSFPSPQASTPSTTGTAKATGNGGAGSLYPSLGDMLGYQQQPQVDEKPIIHSQVPSNPYQNLQGDRHHSRSSSSAASPMSSSAHHLSASPHPPPAYQPPMYHQHQQQQSYPSVLQEKTDMVVGKGKRSFAEEADALFADMKKKKFDTNNSAACESSTRLYARER
jgi:hypothetical protein